MKSELPSKMTALTLLSTLVSAAAAAPGWTVWNSAGYRPTAARSSPFGSYRPRLAWQGYHLGGFGIQRPGINSFPKSNLLDINIVKETREAVNNAKTILEGLKDDKIAAPYVADSLASSQCLDTIDDAIAAVEASAQLVEANGPELIYLAATFKRLESESDVLVQTRSSAKLLRLLEDLVPRLSSSSLNTKCASSSDQRISALSDLAGVLEGIAGSTRAYLPRQAIKFSAEKTGNLASFLGKLGSSVASLQDGSLCARSDYQTAIYSTIEEIMTDLADYIGGVASSAERAATIRSKAQQFSKLAASFESAGLEQPCGSYSSYSQLADIMDDLSAIIEDAGVEVLSNELGIDFNF